MTATPGSWHVPRRQCPVSHHHTHDGNKRESWWPSELPSSLSQLLSLKDLPCSSAQGKFAASVIGSSLTPSLLRGDNQAQRRRGPVQGHTADLRPGWAGATPGWVPRGSLHCALSKQETAALSNLGSRDGERVWLRDWQALKAEPGLSLENNLLERTWAEASVLGERRG